MRQLKDLAGLDQLGGIEHGGRLLMVHCAALVVCAPFGGAALGFRRR
jgi:hypothetical protein